MTRLVDRLISRQGSYSEYMWSGAYPVTAMDSQGRGREGSVVGLVRSAREAYASNGIVAACVMIRMGLFSEAAFKFQSATDGHLFGNTDLSILEHPWPNATSGELLARMEQDGGSLAGNAYIRKAQPADGTDAQLVQMRPDTVTIVSEEVRDDRGRTFRRPQGYAEDLRVLGIERDPQFYDVDEVCHYSPVPDPAAQFRGMSWLTPVLREIGADSAMTTYKSAHLANGAMPGLVIKYSQKLSDKTVETLRKRIGARYGGAENSGKTIVLDEGADMAVAGSTLEQLQFTAVQEAGERRIAAAAQVPLEVLGLARGDYQAAMRRFADVWARPHWRMACASLQHLVPNVPPQGVRLWYDVSGIAALREGELERAQATLVKSQGITSLVGAGFTRESCIAAAESGDMSQLVPSPDAPPPGISGRETATATTREDIAGPGQRPPQAGLPQDLPGVVKPNLPNAKPGAPPVMPLAPTGPPAGRVAGSGRGAEPRRHQREPFRTASANHDAGLSQPPA